LECDVLSFKLKAIAVHDEVDDNSQAMNWDSAIRTLKTKHQSLKGQGLWTPQATTKKQDDEISGLRASLNKLSAHFNAGTGGRRGDRKDTRTCYKCQKSGHFAADCPNKKNSGL
jgi:hypothetical protein